MRTEIIYEDNDILVVYKPAGLATQTAKLGQVDVVSELKNYLVQTPKGTGQGAGSNSGRRAQAVGRETYVGIIHRLDQPVEGLLVFAKNKKAAADLTAGLQRQGQAGSLHKHYYAVVCGKPEENQGRLVDYMYKSPDNLAVIVENKVVSDRVGTEARTKESGGRENQAKEAVLEYKIVEWWANGADVSKNQSERECTRDLSLVDINILTGRFHQIRAQMAHAGMPLLGDVKYGSLEAKELARALGVQTVALCAYSLDFKHPVSKKDMHFQERPRGKAFRFFSEE